MYSSWFVAWLLVSTLRNIAAKLLTPPRLQSSGTTELRLSALKIIWSEEIMLSFGRRVMFKFYSCVDNAKAAVLLSLTALAFNLLTAQSLPVLGHEIAPVQNLTRCFLIQQFRLATAPIMQARSRVSYSSGANHSAQSAFAVCAISSSVATMLNISTRKPQRDSTGSNPFVWWQNVCSQHG